MECEHHDAGAGPGPQGASRPSPPDTTELRRAAHRYADLGWPVFPCQPGGKVPATHHGYLDATVDHAQIDRWWNRSPRASISIATGAPAPDVLDIDVKPGRNGFTALRRVSQAGLLPDALAVIRTPGGGIHLYFPGTGQRCGSLPASAVDFRGLGGSVIAPPSWSAEHLRRYRLMSARPPKDPVSWAAIRDLLHPPAQPARTARLPAADDPGLVDRLAAWLETRPPGNRNCPLFWAARLTASAGLMNSTAREQLIAASLRSGLRGGEREARRTLASGERAATAEVPAAQRPL